jgi:hypothetical protein
MLLRNICKTSFTGRPNLTLEIPHVVTLGYGDGYHVRFKYSGSPQPKMYIHKLVAARFALHVSNSCLKIHSVKHEDAGCYILEALNCFGTILKRFDVRVVGKHT